MCPLPLFCVKVVHIPGKFYLFRIYSFPVLIFQMFSCQQSFNFSTIILGCFWVGFWPELPKMDYSRKNQNRGGGFEDIEDIEFWGILKK